MKRISWSIKALLPVACLMLLSACSADEMSSGIGEDALLTVLGLRSPIGHSEVDSRAAAGFTDITSGSMGLFLDNPAGRDNYAPKKNLKYTASIDGLTVKWSTDKRIFLVSADAEVCAYYPYVDEYTDRNAIPLSSRVHDAAHDLVYSTVSLMNLSNTGVTFQMKRAYALITLNIKRGNIKDDCTVKAVTFGGGLNHSAKLNITDGTMTGTVAADRGKLTFEAPELTEFTVPANSSHVKKEFLLVPLTTILTAGLEVMFTFADGQTASATIGISTLQAGNQYVVNLVLNNTSMGSSVTVDKVWTSHPVDNGGDAYAPIP